MVVEDMRNTGVLGVPEEWFLSWDPDKAGADWKEALAGLQKRATGQNGVMAVKVMANQLQNVEDCLKTYLRPPPGPRYFRLHKVFEDAKWVRLVRKGVVAQAISRLMALQTGVNHATSTQDQEHFAGNLMRGYKEDYNARARYDYAMILRECTAITLENLAWDHFFRDHGIEPLTLVYEEVAKDKEMGHLDQLAELAGLDEEPERQPRKMVKVGNQRNSDFEKLFMADAAQRQYRAE